MRKIWMLVAVGLASCLILMASGQAIAGRCTSPELEKLRAFEVWLAENPDSPKALAISRAVELYNERRRTERESHNAEVRRTGEGYIWTELEDPTKMGDLVRKGYHLPIRAWDPRGNLIYDITSHTRYAGEYYGGGVRLPDSQSGKTNTPHKPETKEPSRSEKSGLIPPKADKYSFGWKREVGYNFEVPKGAVPPVSTAYAYGDIEGLKNIPGIYTDRIGVPCVKDAEGKLRQLFKGSDGYWYAVNDKSIPKDIRYTRGEIDLKGPYGSVSFSSKYIDGIAESYDLDREEAKHRLMAYGDVYVNTYRNHCRGEAGLVNRKPFLTMGKEEFERRYGRRVEKLLDGKVVIPPRPPVRDPEIVEPPADMSPKVGEKAPPVSISEEKLLLPPVAEPQGGKDIQSFFRKAGLWLGTCAGAVLGCGPFGMLAGALGGLAMGEIMALGYLPDQFSRFFPAGEESVRETGSESQPRGTLVIQDEGQEVESPRDLLGK